MERYTAPTYNEALKLAEASIRGKFDVVNSREIDLSSSGISDEKLIEITVETKKNLSPTINSEMSKLNSFEINNLKTLIHEELKPINNMKLELGLLREEVDLLSRRIEQLLVPEMDEEFKRIYNILSGLGMEQHLSKRLIKKYTNIIDKTNNKNKNDIFRQLFKKMFKSLPKIEQIKNGDILLLFGTVSSGKTTVASLLEHKFSKQFDVELINGNLINNEMNINQKKLTILDFTSIHVNQNQSMKKLSELCYSIRKIKKFLVLPAIVGIQDLLHLSACFSPIQPDGLVFSRMDETTQPCKLLTLLSELKFPLFGVTYLQDGIIHFTNDGLDLINDILIKNISLDG